MAHPLPTAFDPSIGTPNTTCDGARAAGGPTEPRREIRRRAARFRTT